MSAATLRAAVLREPEYLRADMLFPLNAEGLQHCAEGLSPSLSRCHSSFSVVSSLSLDVGLVDFLNGYGISRIGSVIHRVGLVRPAVPTLVDQVSEDEQRYPFRWCHSHEDCDRVHSQTPVLPSALDGCHLVS